MSRSVEELFRHLNSISSDLALDHDRKVSMSEALLELIKTMKLKPSDLSWSWRMQTKMDYGKEKTGLT